MAIKNFGFTLDLNALKRDLVEAVKTAVEEAVKTGEDTNVFDYLESDAVAHFGSAVDDRLVEMADGLNDVEFDVHDIAVAVVGETISVSVDVQYNENEPEETEEAVEPSDVSDLLDVLNGLDLSVDQKNRIMAIVNEG